MWWIPEACLEVGQRMAEDRWGSCSQQIKMILGSNSEVHWCLVGQFFVWFPSKQVFQNSATTSSERSPMANKSRILPRKN